MDGGADGRPVFVPRFEKLTNSISFPVRVRGPQPYPTLPVHGPATTLTGLLQSSPAALARVCARRRAVRGPARCGHALPLGIAALLGRHACTPPADSRVRT